MHIDSLRTKLLFMVLGCIVVVQLASIGFADRELRAPLWEEMQKQNRQILDYTSEIIARYLHAPQEWLVRLAEDPLILENSLHPTIDDIALINDRLTVLVHANTVFESILLQSQDGSVMAANQEARSQIGQNFFHHEYAAQTRNTRLPYISSVFLSPFSRRPVLLMTMPVKDLQGVMHGFLVGVIKIQPLSQTLVNLQSNTILLVFDRAGNIFLDTRHPDRITESMVAEHEFPSLLKQIDAGQAEGLVETPERKNTQTTLFVFKKFDAYIVAVGRSVVQMSRVVDIIAQKQAWIAILSLILLAVLAGFSIDFFTSRITRFITIVKKISHGDFSTHAALKDLYGKDEIGVLARSFQNMQEKLEDMYQTLEQKVSQRTQEVEVARHALQEKVRELKWERHQFTILIENLPVGVLMVSAPLGTVLALNPRARELLGCALEQDFVLTRPYTEISQIFQSDGAPYPVETLPLTQALHEGRLETKRDLVVKTDAGASRVLSSVAVPVKNASGHTISAIAVFDDITREKEVDRIKTEFVSLASHQLRTPLSSMGWYLELLLDGEAGVLEPTQREYLEEVAHGNQRMVNLVNELLNVSRLELGTFIIEPQSSDITEIIRAALHDLSPKIEEKHLTIKQIFEEHLPLIETDPKWFSIVIENLLSNAIKYTPEQGDVEVRITKTSLSQPSQTSVEALCVRVKDTGYGIPQHQQSKIFNKLFRADNVKEHDTEGTGLGLYMVKRIIEYSGGKIWFESQENHGTSFFVVLPLRFHRQQHTARNRNSAR